jgi:LysM repeat protein
MPKQIFTGLFIAVCALVLAGCAGGGVTTRSYIEDKERIDQKMEGGNFGYLMGTPVAEDRSEYKKSRKVYVMEFTKNPDVEEEDIDVSAPKSSSSSVLDSYPEEKSQPAPQWSQPIEIPSFDDESEPEAEFEPEAEPGAASFVDYTVQKNDTLQKISKKFYDSYSKWPRIMEANKDVIKNANQIKPGMTLRIPQ